MVDTTSTNLNLISTPSMNNDVMRSSKWTNETTIQATNATQQALLQTCTRKPEGEWSKGLLILAYVIIFLVAIGGNSLIVHIVRVRKKSKTAFDYLIFNMAIADILDVLVASPTHVGYMLFGGIFPSGAFGEVICKLQQYLMAMSISTSVLTLIVIAIDRYLAIVHVRKRQLRIRTVKRALVCIWIMSGGLLSYELYRMQLFLLPNGKFTCGVNWGFDFETNELLYKADMMVKLVLLYVIPLIVTGILYSIILVNLWQRKVPGEFNHRIQKRTERQNRKVVKMLVTMVLVFAVCWLPTHVNNYLIAFHWLTYECSISYEVMILFYWVTHANAAINPCLYLTFNETFREGFKLIFKKVHGKEINITERNSNTREIIKGATAIPNTNSTHGTSTPQLMGMTLNTWRSEYIADLHL